jgi:hypothetical protein
MTGAIPNRELVVYALWLLGGESKRIHTEDIALKCHELFPHSFSWTKHPQYPDKDIVRVALTDARKPQHGSLVEGRAGQKRGLTAKTKREPVPDGWILTPAGITWIQKNISTLEKHATTDQIREHRQRLLQQLRRVRDHRLFSDYWDSPEKFYPSLGDLADLLRCRVDAELQTWNKRFENMIGKAQAAEDTEVLDFLERCHKAYTSQR